jgi:demethylmenaquinone methyltransferase / 2-methoxy-6-polyprenyl-1,4-benzoquinol methylase
MAISILPDQDSSLNKKKQIENMFDDIAPRYDFLNRLMSMRIDVLWRKRVIKLLQANQPKLILDVATGTGDLAIALQKLNPNKVVGLDLSQQMLSIAEEKIKSLHLTQSIELIKGDGEQLPFADNSFDAVTVAFGVRNFENLEKGLKEIQRVLKPQGQFVILEFSKIKMFPFKQFFGFYFRYITPILGKMFSKSNKAYTYLTNSVAVFPEGEEMCVILQQLGFKKTKCHTLSLGIASIYHSEK